MKPGGPVVAKSKLPEIPLFKGPTQKVGPPGAGGLPSKLGGGLLGGPKLPGSAGGGPLKLGLPGAGPLKMAAGPLGGGGVSMLK